MSTKFFVIDSGAIPGDRETKNSRYVLLVGEQVDEVSLDDAALHLLQGGEASKEAKNLLERALQERVAVASQP